MGTMARGSGIRLEFGVALKAMRERFSTDGGYVVHF